ncbi:hypothetical protein F383_29129 [Gossypium arboreum]|uniref:Uncharacterized protein n=1 Tax=Gossypium arboreum TaxID=29729 RepID=A0A0B0MY65_GOSAR|nr:hypothetical protein F383_29129 [Gossypium arboreum]
MSSSRFGPFLSLFGSF